MYIESPSFIYLLTSLADQDPKWCPTAGIGGQPLTGRSFQLLSLLGPFFSMTPVPDQFLSPKPDVIQQCFSGLENRRRSDIESAILGMRAQLLQTTGGLQRIVEGLLRGAETRSKVLEW